MDWAARMIRPLLSALAILLPAILTGYILWRRKEGN